MTLQTIPGQGLWMPEPYVISSSYSSNLIIDATGEKVAFIGRVFNKDKATKDITKVGFRFGAVTKAGGSALTVSLQDVDASNGPVPRPDETQDQTVAIANGNASFAANTWIQTAALSANRTVAFGELIAVVIEFDGSGRLSSDTVAIAGMAHFASTEFLHQPLAVLKSGAGPTWALQGALSAVILEFTDGTFGTLFGSLPSSNFATLTFKQDTAGSDEYALEFQLPFPCKVDGMWAMVSLPATADFSVVLYSGTTAMTNGTIAVDANNTIKNTSVSILKLLFPGEVTLAANTTYRLAIKPTQTTGSVTLYYIDVANANHFQALEGGTSWALTSRLDLGSWAAPTTTRRPLMGIHVSSLDDGVGGGGMLFSPGMMGGFNG